MSLVAYNADTFVRANSELVGATMSDGIGAWSSNDAVTGIHSVSSNQYLSTAGSWNNVPLFNTNMSATEGDQAAEVKILSLSNAGGPTVRYSSGPTYYYVANVTATGCVVRRAAGSYPGSDILTLTGKTIAVNDLIKLEAIGSTLTVYINGASIGSVTDATYATGRCGIWNAFSQYWGDYQDYITGAAPAQSSGFLSLC